MESTSTHPEDQVARAKRLREHIEGLKSGRRPEPDPGHKPSIREQVEERAREQQEQE
jgi:hypothetical protein